MKDEEIQKKLIKLESAVLKESTQVSASQKSTELVSDPSRPDADPNNPDLPTKDDFKYFGGMCLVMVGFFLLFQHVKVMSGYFSWWGLSPGSSIGMLFIPLLIGIGWIFYNSKSMWGWILSAVSLLTMVFTIISGLRVYFEPISVLGMIFMLLPFSLGCAMILQGMGGPKGVELAIRNKIAESKEAKSK